MAKSANENEAAIALRQAQSLMREFQIDPDLLDIVEASCESKATKIPQAWEASLVMTIARAMQCKPILVLAVELGALKLHGHLLVSIQHQKLLLILLMSYIAK